PGGEGAVEEHAEEADPGEPEPGGEGEILFGRGHGATLPDGVRAVTSVRFSALYPPRTARGRERAAARRRAPAVTERMASSGLFLYAFLRSARALTEGLGDGTGPLPGEDRRVLGQRRVALDAAREPARPGWRPV